MLVALEKVSDLIARPRRAHQALCSWENLFGRSSLFVRHTADWRGRREIWSPTAIFDSRLLLLLRKLTQMGVVEGGTLMGAGGERVRNLDSSAQAEKDMAVEVKYELKMVLHWATKTSPRGAEIAFPASKHGEEQLRGVASEKYISFYSALLRMSQ